jgi:hypothetical protein
MTYPTIETARVPSRPPVAPLLVPFAVGAAVSVALGVYGRLHQPTGFAIGVAGFSGPLAMKAWLTTGAVVLAIVQLLSALAMYGRLGSTVPGWVGVLHRWSGRGAFLLTVPVAFHCLYSLGLGFDSPRVLVHSVLGCFFYGVFTAKMLTLTRRGLPGWALPLLGGLAFATLAGLWVTASLFFFTTFGPHF